MDKPQKRNGPFLALLPLWHITSWTEMAILLGYIGVIISAVDLGRKYLQDSYRKKSAQKYSEEMILNLKKVLRLFFIFVLLAGIFTYVGLWSIYRPPPIELVHLLILADAYIAISYIDLSMKEKSSHISSPEPQKSQESQDKYLAAVKKIWYVNPVILLIFCIFYTQVKSFPFRGVWGVLAWALSVLTTYPVAPILSSDMFKELKFTEQKRDYIFILIMSWVAALFWLSAGEGLHS
jgi:magnesium-transporting ATPase (P-type)